MTLQERLRATESMRAHGHHEAADTCELAAAELDRLQARVSELEVDAERWVWLEHALFVRRWNGVIDSGSRTDWTIAPDWRHVTAKMVGDDFRAAIDTARKAKP